MGQLPPVIAVFDINVYLNVARLVGEPYSKIMLHTRLIKPTHDPSERLKLIIESAKLVAVTTSGVFAGNQSLQIWTSDWIVKGTINVAKRPVSDKGLGWGLANAQALEADLIFGTAVGPSNGLQLPTNKSAKFDGLSSDDAQVLSTALEALSQNPSSQVICVTNDTAFRNTTWNGGVLMMTSGEFLTLITASRKALKPLS